ncbi:hypothetical protein Tco_1446010 [Tanacetum coccineum]
MDIRDEIALSNRKSKVDSSSTHGDDADDGPSKEWSQTSRGSVNIRDYPRVQKRVLILTLGWIIFLSCYIPMHVLLKRHDKLRKRLERALVELICSFFVASWTVVVKDHGPQPSARPK